MSSFDELKQLPHNLKAEEWLLSIVLSDENKYYDTKAQSEWFYSDFHRNLFKAIKSIKGDWRKLDVGLVQQYLPEEQKELVREVYSNYWMVYTSSNLKTYEQEIYNNYVQRSIIISMRNVVSDCYDWEDISKILTKISHATDFWSMEWSKKASDVIIDVAMNIGKNKNFISQYWYKDLDKALWWYVEWQLVIIGARPWVWKTLVASNFIDTLTEKKVPACFFTLEMTAEEIAKRILSKRSEVSMRALDSDESIVDKVQVKAGSMLESWYDFDIIDEMFEYSSICIEIKRQVIKNGCKVVFIDYLGLIDYADGWRTDNTLFAISQITKWFKRLAKEMGITIVLLSQLNRDGASGKPTKAQLRSSGSIEQDADVVILLYQDHDNDMHANYVNFIIDKNRNGVETSVFLGVEKRTMKIYDVDQSVAAHF